MDQDKTRRALEDASTLRREVQFICVFDSKCHEMKQLRIQIFKKNYLGAYARLSWLQAASSCQCVPSKNS